MAPDSSPIGSSTPSSARIYNYFLGGEDNFAVDREAAETFMAMFSTVLPAARANRGFVLRAARAMAEAGVRQFLDIGCGLPLEPNVHDIALSVHVDARVVYVDNDPSVVASSQAQLDRPGQVVTIAGDLRDPATIIANPDVAQLLDFTKPVGLLTVAILHFIPEDAIGEYLAHLRRALAPGSQFALTHVCPDNIPASEVEAGQALYQQTTNPVRPRTRAEILALFDGWTLLEPGLCPAADWRPVDGDPYPEQAPESFAGVGILPLH
ncbi:SAM-dependent methyltransferase [Nonomuraea sp. NPDC005650]|uniref:SAM-dependent methyltransferase n=1 Tax=Nonomuraea sp. NPDC005650 TaxID=3157045 RepID=UPI0033B04C63